MPVLTMLRILLNWPLSKMIWGFRRARSQAAMAVSRKQWPSRNSRNGSLRRSLRLSERRPARACFFGSAAKRRSVRSAKVSNSWPRMGNARMATSMVLARRRSSSTGVISSTTVTRACGNWRVNEVSR